MPWIDALIIGTAEGIDLYHRSISPMLAHSWTAEIDPAGWWMSEKIDGVRAIWTGKEFITRGGNPIAAPAWFTRDLVDEPLDGELTLGRGTFQKTAGLVQSERRNSKSWRRMRYMIFDAPRRPGGFEERLRWIEGYFAANEPRYAHVLAQTRCEGRRDLAHRLEVVTAAGGEGLMLRRPGSEYAEGKRSRDLLKVKVRDEIDATVIAVERRKAGRVAVVEADDGLLFTVAIRGKRQTLDFGDRIIIAHNGFTDEGVPRFPRIIGRRAD